MVSGCLPKKAAAACAKTRRGSETWIKRAGQCAVRHNGGCRAARGCVGQEFGAVGLRTGQREKHVTRLHMPGITGNAARIHILRQRVLFQ
jgi:hypothetical protein